MLALMSCERHSALAGFRRYQSAVGIHAEAFLKAILRYITGRV